MKLTKTNWNALGRNIPTLAPLCKLGGEIQESLNAIESDLDQRILRPSDITSIQSDIETLILEYISIIQQTQSGEQVDTLVNDLKEKFKFKFTEQFANALHPSGKFSGHIHLRLQRAKGLLHGYVYTTILQAKRVHNFMDIFIKTAATLSHSPQVYQEVGWLTLERTLPSKELSKICFLADGLQFKLKHLHNRVLTNRDLDELHCNLLNLITALKKTTKKMPKGIKTILLENRSLEDLSKDILSHTYAIIREVKYKYNDQTAQSFVAKAIVRRGVVPKVPEEKEKLKL